MIRLASDRLTVAVDPAAGGRVVSLVDARGREALWRSATLPLVAPPPGTAFDPVFAGGWDDLLPNDEPERWRGRTLADHGELWTAPMRTRERAAAWFTVLEPATGWPTSFAAAAAAGAGGAEGRLPRIEPGASLETEVRCRVGPLARAHLPSTTPGATR